MPMDKDANEHTNVAKLLSTAHLACRAKCRQMPLWHSEFVQHFQSYKALLYK